MEHHGLAPGGGLGRMRHLFGLVVARAGGSVFNRQLGRGHIGVVVRLYTPRGVYAGGIDLYPFGVAGVVGSAHKRGSAHIGDLRYRFFCSKPVCDFHDRALGIAVQK